MMLNRFLRSRCLANACRLGQVQRPLDGRSIVHHDVLLSRSFHGSRATRFNQGEPSKPMGLFDRITRFSRSSSNEDDKDVMEELLNMKQERTPAPPPKAASDCSSAQEVDDDDEDEYVDMFNPETGEWNGPRHGEPTRYGDWAIKGRATDFE